MSYEEFLANMEAGHPPDHAILLALFLDGRGHWDEAHDIVNEMTNLEGERIHAYLHRKEGDLWNARYWYHRIGLEVPDISLEEEWEQLVRLHLH